MKNTISIKETLSTRGNVTFITEWLSRNKGKTRTRLARELCERLGLRDGKGALRISTTLKALRELEAGGYWKLPAAIPRGNGQWNPRRLGHEVAVPRGVPAEAGQIKGLELIEVCREDEAHVRIWNELMLEEHPLHDCRLVGRQLRYLVGSGHGWLGGIGFGSSALYLESREKWIGWDEKQRAEYHERVINMTRFLIRESVQCRNLASHVLGLCSGRVAKDFQKRYGVEPWLMESFRQSGAVWGHVFSGGELALRRADQGAGSKREQEGRQEHQGCIHVSAGAEFSCSDGAGQDREC
jgi:hypothetical protein